VGVPLAQLVIAQPALPALASGHSSKHCEVASHSTLQLESMHRNRQLLPGPQWQVPLAHSPVQLGFSPSQLTWQGPAEQLKSHSACGSQVHSPLAQVPSHAAPLAQVT
jgi:hypothetical protein